MTYDQNGDLVTALQSQRQAPLGGVEVGFGGGQPIGWRPTGEAHSLDQLRLIFQNMRGQNLADALGQPRPTPKVQPKWY